MTLLVAVLIILLLIRKARKKNKEKIGVSRLTLFHMEHSLAFKPYDRFTCDLTLC
ncbi:hypothetical protein AAG663_00745 [Bacillus licheniformis]